MNNETCPFCGGGLLHKKDFDVRGTLDRLSAVEARLRAMDETGETYKALKLELREFARVVVPSDQAIAKNTVALEAIKANERDLIEILNRLTLTLVRRGAITNAEAVLITDRGNRGKALLDAAMRDHGGPGKTQREVGP